MSTPIARLAAKLANVERQVQSLASAPQLANASLDVDGEYVEVSDGVRTAFEAQATATEAQTAIASTQAELDQASADLAQAQLDVAQAKTDVAQAKIDVAAAAAAAATAQTTATNAQSAATAASTAASTAKTQADKGVADANAAAQAAAAAQSGLATKAGIDYVASRGTNLVTNGTGMLGTNLNFTAYTFDGSDAPVGAAGAFLTPLGSNATRLSDEFMPVDPTKKQRLSVSVRNKGTTTTGGYLYTGLQCYDAAKLAIDPAHYMYVAGTLTTLAAPLNPGDTTVTLTSAANWYGSAGKPGGNNYYWRRFIFWDYVDSFGKAWAENTYSRNVLTGSVGLTPTNGAWSDGGLVGNVITLNAPYAGPAKPAGTKVSNGTSGGSYMYVGAAANTVRPADGWVTFAQSIVTGTVVGTSSASATTGWPPGVGFVKLITLANRVSAGTADALSQHSFALWSFGDAAAAQADADAATTAAATADGKAVAAQSKADAVDTLTTGWKKIGSVLMDGGKIFADSIGAGAIAADAILARNIKAGEITAAKLVAGTLTSASGVFGDISAASITSGVLNAARIAADTITSVHLATDAVTAVKIAADAVTAVKIAAGAVVADKIAAKAIRAEHLAIGDLSNMAELDTTGQSTVKWGTWSSGVSNGWVTRVGTKDNYFMFRNKKGPLPFKTGERIKVTFEAYASAATSPALNLYVYDPSNTLTSQTLATVPLTTSVQSFSIEAGVLPDTIGKVEFLVGMFGTGLATTDVFLRNVRIYRMNAGELIVDGSISATSLAADAIDGKTITGSLFRTSASGERIEVQPGTAAPGSNNEIQFWPSSPTEFAEPTRIIHSDVGPDGITILTPSSTVTGDGTGGWLQRALLSLNGTSSGGVGIHQRKQSLGIAGYLAGLTWSDLNGGSVEIRGKKLSFNVDEGFKFWTAPPGGASTLQAFPPQEFRWSVSTTTTTTVATPTAMSTRGGQGTFVAPPSGTVTIAFGGQSKSGAAGQYAAIGIELREGSTVGSGNVTRAYDVNESFLNYSVDYQVGMLTIVQTGLIPGQTYNVRNVMASGTTTASTVLRGRIVVTPSL